MSDKTRTELYLYYSRIPNTGFHPDFVKKRFGLMMIGLSEEEAEKLCKPKPIDLDAVMEQMMKEQEKQLRWLAKLSPRRKKEPKPGKSDCATNDEIEIAWVDIKCPDQFKTKDGVEN